MKREQVLHSTLAGQDSVWSILNAKWKDIFRGVRLFFQDLLRVSPLVVSFLLQFRGWSWELIDVLDCRRFLVFLWRIDSYCFGQYSVRFFFILLFVQTCIQWLLFGQKLSERDLILRKLSTLSAFWFGGTVRDKIVKRKQIKPYEVCHEVDAIKMTKEKTKQKGTEK